MQKDIKDSLIKQLEIRGAKTDCFVSLIDDYIWLWTQQKEMKNDVKKRGRTYKAVSAAGKDYEKDNPSVKNAILYNKQMLQILKDLGLTTDNVASGDDGEL